MENRIRLERIGEIVHGVLTELKKRGEPTRMRELLDLVEPRLQLTEYEKDLLPKSGNVRWRSYVHFYSIDCVKAGYLLKSGGRWSLTPEGERALKQKPADFIRGAVEKYRAWKSQQAPVEEPGDIEPEIEIQSAYEQAVELAGIEIEQHINELSPYEFQDLVAELLIAMGYHVPHVAKPGKDGGIDITAYRDPLGMQSPRMKVQVKHREQKMTVKEVREMEGLLRKEGDIGLVVSSGGFSGDIDREIRASTKHIESMDLDRLIRLWEQHYDKVSEKGKSLLPLARLYFLKPKDE